MDLKVEVQWLHGVINQDKNAYASLLVSFEGLLD